MYSADSGQSSSFSRAVALIPKELQFKAILLSIGK